MLRSNDAPKRSVGASVSKGVIDLVATRGNSISEEALATLPPFEGGDFTGERAVWEGKFYIE